MNGLSRICFCFRTFALVLNMSFDDTLTVYHKGVKKMPNRPFGFTVPLLSGLLFLGGGAESPGENKNCCPCL